MKFVDEYRSEQSARRVLEAIRRSVTRQWTLMEVCGGQTHTLIKSGIDQLLPEAITLVHGPGCPVCVTPLELIEKAIAIARHGDVIFTSFGDMLRVPGVQADLLQAKALGGDVRIVYSPLDAVALAQRNPGRQVVFFAVGFETTAPTHAMAVWQAQRLGLDNFSILCANVLVPPAMELILSAPTNAVQAFLAAGHVCTVTGYRDYEPLSARYRVPIVVTGFEPLDLLLGIHAAVQSLETGQSAVINRYARSVTREGNTHAQRLVQQVFEVCDRPWRGIGAVPRSGLRLRSAFALYDAERRFGVGNVTAEESPLCIAGEILQGLRKPTQCSAFAGRCNPEHPLGAPMVSQEGACAAYFQFGRS